MGFLTMSSKCLSKYHYLALYLIHIWTINHIGDIMANVLALSVVERVLGALVESNQIL
jgi:hypothetical protein